MPQRQAPFAEQLSAFAELQLAQTPPSAPQAPRLPTLHTAPAQHPPAHVTALQAVGTQAPPLHR
jgi:hypothetical protein